MAMRGIYVYTADDGTQYRVLIPIWMYSVNGTHLGFAADDASKAFLPRGMRMRYRTAKDGVSLRHRKLHAGNTTDAVWTTTSLAVTLPNIDGTSTSYTTDGWVGQRRRGI